jgi:hypothetical protein
MLFAIQATHTLGRVMTQKQLTDAMTTSQHHYRSSDRCSDAAVSSECESSARAPHPCLTDPRRDP